MNSEKVIKGLECCTAELGTNQHRSDFCAVCPYKDKHLGAWYCFHKNELMRDALALLKARVLTLEEIKDYLNDPDGDKKPLWLEWHTIPALSGWVLASQVSDLMKRYMDSYNNTWRPWTSRPTDEQREAVKWE